MIAATSRMPKSYSRIDARRLRALAVITSLVVALSGCYDGSALVQAQHDEVNLVRMDEVDLGKFRITLPRVPGASGGGVVEFHAFGQVARRDHDDVAKAFELNGPELRYRVLLLVRSLDRKELDEPKLQKLRDDIAKLANASLEHKMIKNVGFYSFTYSAM
jgi:hypothetical protein